MMFWVLSVYAAIGLVIGVACFVMARQEHVQIVISGDVSVPGRCVWAGAMWPAVAFQVVWFWIRGTRVRGWLERVSLFIGHHAVPIAVVLAALGAVWMTLVPDESRWNTWIGLAMIAVVVWWSLQLAFHGGRMCLDCAADVPLDPQVTVDRRRRRLAAFHWFYASARWHRYTLTAVTVALVSGHFAGPVGWWLSGLAYFPLIVDAVLITTHHKLTPWCPLCRRGWGDGGDEEPSPDPEPAPGNEVRA